MSNIFLRCNQLFSKELVELGYMCVFVDKILQSTYKRLAMNDKLSGLESGENLQKKLYFLVEQLQNMQRDLPSKYQMRVPCELLTSLANCLLNDTIFEIVKGLMEIQHVTEKQLFQQRLQLINKHKIESGEIMALQSLSQEEKINEIAKINLKQREELKQFDMKLVLQLDQKVSDQQITLEKAGVPGFYVTNSPLEIKVQMYLLDFILRLSKMTVPS